MSWDNSRISYRQLKRILALELFGMASLLLPSELTRAGNGSGFGGLILGTTLAGCMVSVLICCMRQMDSETGKKNRITDYFSYLGNIWGKWTALLFYICYGIICLVASAYVMKLLTSLLCTILLEQSERSVISVILVLLAVYGASAGLEVRARISELLYWLLFIPFFLLLLLCIRQIEPVEWFPIWNDSGAQEIRTTVRSVLAFLPVQLLLFLPPHTNSNFQYDRGIHKVVMQNGLLLGLIQLVLLGIFGQKALGAEQYPLMVLLGMVKIPGDFIKRLDIVMVAIWFFALMTFAEALLSYAAVIFDRIGTFLQQRLFGTKTNINNDEIRLCGIAKWKYGITGVVIFLFVHILFGHAQVEKWIEWTFLRMVLPFLVLLPVLSCLLFSLIERVQIKARFVKKTLGLVFCVLAGMYLSGCSATELEDKNFPLAVTVELTENGCRSAYLFQNLYEMSSGKLKGTQSQFGTGETYFESRQDYEKNHRIQLDTGHTKALIIQKSFMDDIWQRNNFLETVRTEHTFARNTLLYLTEEPMDKIEKLNQTLDMPLGSYLEQMEENDKQIREEAVVTLAALLNEQNNRNRTLLIPVLSIRDGSPVISSYEVLQDFQMAGSVTPQQALYYYLFHGGLEQWNLVSEQAQFRMRSFRIRTDFVSDTKVDTSKQNAEFDKVLIRIQVHAKAQRISGDVSFKRLQQQLEKAILCSCKEQLEVTGVDLSDSYHLLAMKAPELYQLFQNKSDEYRECLEYEILFSLE